MISWRSILSGAALTRRSRVSWQDTGSGVFTLALASLLLGIVMRCEPAGKVIGLAATVGLVPFLVDIYLY